MNIDRKIVKFTLAYILGIIMGYKLVPIYILVLTGVFLILGVLMHKNINMAFVFLFAFILGIIAVGFNTGLDTSLISLEGEEVEIVGQIKPKAIGKGRYILQVEKINRKKLDNNPLILVQFRKDSEENFAWKDIVQLRGKLQSLNIATNPGEFSEKTYWNNQQVTQKIFVLEPAKLLKEGQGVFAKSYYLRQVIHKEIGRAHV